ncbi:MAG: hypothetical protein ACTSRA_20760 [Promethearchaeota archaeon]
MFRKILSGCLVAIFIPFFIVLILGFAAKSTFLNPDFYKNQLSKEEVYTKIISHGLSLFTQNMIVSDTPIIGSDSLALTIQSTIKPEWVKEQFSTFFNSISNYISGKTNTLSGRISFKEFKKNLSNKLNETANQSIENLPECTDEQMKQFDINNVEDISKISLDCIPSGNITDNIKDGFKKMISGSFIIETIPDEINLSEFGNKNIDILNTLRKTFKYISWGTYILLYINLLMLLFIGLLIYKPIDSVMRWIATAIVIPSSVVFITAIIGYSSSKIIVKNFILPPEAAVQLISLTVDIAQKFINGYLKHLLIYSSIPLIISMILYIWAYCINKNQHKKQAEKLKPSIKQIKSK